VVATQFIYPIDPLESLRNIVTSLYFHLMKMKGLSFFALTLLIYGLGALLFSGLYWVARSQVDPPFGGYEDAFFYSAERMVNFHFFLSIL
jgi:hypothetical protein